MKVGYIAKSNKKGQIVIPKEVREALGITTNASLNIVMRENALYVYPIKEVLGESEKDDSYIKILEKTKGTWKDDDWDETAKKRKKIELAASKRRKAW